MKQLEQQILQNILDTFKHDNSKTVIINSVWYTANYHKQVLEDLKAIKPTRVVVVAMLDPPNVDLAWFSQLNCEVIGIGYYPGSDVDYFACFMDRFYKPSNDDLLNSKCIDTAFMCLNRKPHPHRLRLYHALETADLLDKGFVSMGGKPPIRLLENDVIGQTLAPNGGPEQYGIVNDIASLGNIHRWQRHFLNIVTETVWDIDACNFLSEKTFKPVLGLRPFLLYAANGGIECLRQRGIEPYVKDFGDISDIDLSEPYNIVEFLKVLTSQPQSYLEMKFAQLRDKLLFNKEQFNRYVRKL